MNVWPAITSVPLRDGPVLVATVNVTVELPLAIASAVMMIHETVLPAIHVHSKGAVTLTTPVPPDAEIV